ncbi:uncharacterized protein LOC125654109 [Ostrea edulis]|uniref:uncharacterized protein LOC125654109 n=1 Tax=Ostrea edulis TaxID=37623 RepID=UPI0024AFBD4D|nr:uncharacterized protein LOC125654109 [Ostrea edulis]
MQFKEINAKKRQPDMIEACSDSQIKETVSFHRHFKEITIGSLPTRRYTFLYTRVSTGNNRPAQLRPDQRYGQRDQRQQGPAGNNGDNQDPPGQRIIYGIAMVIGVAAVTYFGMKIKGAWQINNGYQLNLPVVIRIL